MADPQLNHLADMQYCYLTTIGRVTGSPHEIEIWFGHHDDVLYLLSGGRTGSDWVRNLQADPAIQLRIKHHTFTGTARIVTDLDEDALARRLLAAKYQGWQPGQPMTDWAQSALPVAISLD